MAIADRPSNISNTLSIDRPRGTTCEISTRVIFSASRRNASLGVVNGTANDGAVFVPRPCPVDAV